MSQVKFGFDVEKVRKDFPILSQKVYGKPLIYLDNAATAQTPQSVVDAICRFYTEECSNIHRGVHQLSVRATNSFEAARAKVAQFIGAASPREIIFTRGTTEGINLVAQSWGREKLGAGDEVVISAMEHHSNIVPWQLLCHERGAILRIIPMTDRGELDLDEYGRLLGAKTKVVAVTHVSNALGTVNPVAEMTRLAHSHDAVVLLDGAQAAPHLPVNVQALDCDFYCLSGHKLYGPTGIGVLYGKTSLLEAMPPYQGGGDMISSVTFEKTTFNTLPYKFEAGTPDIAGVYGLGAAVDYLSEVGLEEAARYEHELLEYATEAVSKVPGVRLIGTAA
ncbi:MAG TPA: SufS family cysteine desulfurase, partial [Candidatus Eisenbacteria bacterium]|nr:SufS family cysteine desulfurase [Candidatus Eisenbacteria bacterium]